MEAIEYRIGPTERDHDTVQGKLETFFNMPPAWASLQTQVSYLPQSLRSSQA